MRINLTTLSTIEQFSLQMNISFKEHVYVVYELIVT